MQPPPAPQMDLNASGTTKLVHWLVHTAPPVQRNDFLTRLGRLPPRPLGAALFSALLGQGRPQDALRLLRHAGALPDAELAALVKEHMVEGQVGG